MNTSHSDRFDLEAYVAGEAGTTDQRDVEQHLTTCAECREEVESLREMQEFLGALPPEALLDGPPDDADLLLQRTLRQIRSESAGARGRGRILAASAAVVVAAAALGAGVLVGKSGDGGAGTAVASPPISAPATVAPGTRNAVGASASGARLNVAVSPAVGWIQLNASVTGIPAGQKCRLVVVGKDGSREIAGNWLVSKKAETDGVNLSGSALVDPANVASVVVENTDGHQFVSASL
ncbi:zf-HC2 domain-containing protein [Amycolatopsis rhabdoformis]|uniref:Zf-HC2 domain-containing protein n=1 Tax=Amycolatopsis rhabdoformis TaxID=1448059 RepID=A0ABZ1HZA2_9PSEU|nr:zf-HC2 domain-containing protein [Amycolatopsis rhabdoformis]WSE26831.1 zf-HC2 domain-containing protein [Amycolatopsis rhabdoformis]